MDRKMNKGMMDNRHVSENHQEGISRVLQRKGDMQKGQGGKMHASPEHRAEWERKDKAMTPRPA
jgi:hypothetical protein